jgi:CheY-like chemotaxis protein
MTYRPIILIADDDPDWHDLVKIWFPAEEYILKSARDGTECLEQALLLDPDLILLDVIMPNMDGFEVCRRIRREPELAEIPIIMLSASADQNTHQKGIQAGADDFIPKLIDRYEFQARIRSITRLNRYRKLLSERERFKWVIDQAEDGFLIINEKNEVIDANSRARLFLGLLKDSILPEGLDFLELAGREYRFEPENAWTGWPNDICKPSPSKRYLIRPQTDNSQAFWLEVSVLEQVAGDKINRLIRLRNVTDEKKGICRIHSFESAISFKLRNRLAGMVSTINTLARKDIEIDRSEFSKLFQFVVNNASFLQDELIQILKYLESPNLLYSDTGFNFDQLEPLIMEISEGLGISPPRIEAGDDCGGVETLISDLAMESILWELFQNSKKFHPAKLPEIIVTLERPDSGILRMRIIDNGISLSPDQLSRVWSPYYQGGEFLYENSEGMGLGLPTIASYVWHWGGKCHLYNRKDQPGVVVELDLPERMGDGE